MKRAALWATLLLVTACGSGGTPTAAVTPPSAAPPASTAPSPPASPTSAPGTCDASHRCLALVTLRGSEHIVVRDITDLLHPRTIADLGVSHSPQFASATQISYVDGDALFVAPLTGSPATRVASAPGMGYLVAWSRDGRVAYLAGDELHINLHQVAGGEDKVLETGIQSVPAVGCETQFCSTEGWDLSLEYSPDGTAISFVDHIVGVRTFRVWTTGGAVSSSSDDQDRFMATWSGNGLYFLDGKTGVDVFRNGSITAFLPGTQWIYPNASPAGDQIVFTVMDRQRWHHVFVVDTQTGHALEIKKGRSNAGYLTSRYLWYRGERACIATDRCPAGWNVVGNGQTYVYDLQTHTEYTSIITNIWDTWPHAA